VARWGECTPRAGSLEKEQARGGDLRGHTPLIVLYPTHPDDAAMNGPPRMCGQGMSGPPAV
jgi:hypothetical protein